MNKKGLKGKQLETLEYIRHMETATCKDIAAHFGITVTAAADRMVHLRARKLVRVCDWVRPETRGSWSPVFSISNHRPDAPRPPAMDRKEKDKRYRERNKARAKVSNAKYNKRTINMWAGLMS